MSFIALPLHSQAAELRPRSTWRALQQRWRSRVVAGGPDRLPPGLLQQMEPERDRQRERACAAQVRGGGEGKHVGTGVCRGRGGEGSHGSLSNLSPRTLTVRRLTTPPPTPQLLAIIPPACSTLPLPACAHLSRRCRTHLRGWAWPRVCAGCCCRREATGSAPSRPGQMPLPTLVRSPRLPQ